MTRNSNKELLERFNNFADSYLNKNGNKLIGIDDAHEHLEQKIDNSIRFSSLREEAAKQLKELGINKSKRESLQHLFNAFYLGGLGDGIDFMVDHSEPQLKLAANQLACRYYAFEDGARKSNPNKESALEIAGQLKIEKPTLSTPDIARITLQRMKGLGVTNLPAELTIRDWIYNANKKS